MKHLATVFNALLWLICCMSAVCVLPAAAQQSVVDPMPESHADSAVIHAMDSVDFSLLTCQPHDEVYSLYGHTAIRLCDRRSRSIDAAFNYGIFNFHAPFFVMRFVFGLTDYELGAYPYNLFLAEYRRFGSMVTEQVLNLTSQEKGRLYAALLDNVKPENKIYRYNYFYSNCTLKARDIIEQCIDGRIEYAEGGDSVTWRSMVHDMTRNNPWSRWGNDVLLGVMADQPADRRQQEFLPNNLMYDFDRAQIVINGESRPLVRERRVVVPPGVQIVKAGFPLSPTVCFGILLLVSVVLCIFQHMAKHAYRCWDALLMFASGLVGLVLTLMLFSQHPTVSLNLQILFFNPIHWLFLWSVMKGRPVRRYWYAVGVMAVLYAIGAVFQSYAEGLWCLAASMALQAYIHIEQKMT